MSSLLAICVQTHIWWLGNGGSRETTCAGSVLPRAESQKHSESNSDVQDITYVWGRKMICACPMASSECSIPSPHTSPQSKGRLAWVEDVVLACPLHSKQLRRKTAPKPRNYAATLPLRMSHCLCLHRGAEKTCFLKRLSSWLWKSQAVLLPCLTTYTLIKTANLAPCNTPGSGSALC